ncbi:hypothetical protein [Nocardioides lijunqiniae]|uniref:hypothetical protein n=1 Tax=Nocardioides lijunqiniae TaxID=2760832 RepID=UPI0018779B72|nr:hypothetical protein [Nocardioides lijunqiniae]
MSDEPTVTTDHPAGHRPRSIGDTVGRLPRSAAAFVARDRLTWRQSVEGSGVLWLLVAAPVGALVLRRLIKRS